MRTSIDSETHPRWWASAFDASTGSRWVVEGASRAEALDRAVAMAHLDPDETVGDGVLRVWSE